MKIWLQGRASDHGVDLEVDSGVNSLKHEKKEKSVIPDSFDGKSDDFPSQESSEFRTWGTKSDHTFLFFSLTGCNTPPYTAKSTP